MLDIGWSEMAMIALIALIVIGPKDLPRVMRTAGHWMRKARTVARDFQSSLEDMIEDEDIREAKDSIERQAREAVSDSDAASRPGKRGAFDIGQSLEKQVDPDGGLRKSMREIEHQARSSEPASASASESKRGSGSGASEGVRSGTGGGTGTDVVTHDTSVAPGHSANAAPPAAEPEVKGSADGAGEPATRTARTGEPARERAATSGDSSA